jgi:MFS family permease
MKNRATSLWGNRNFLIVWLGQSVSMFGTRVSYIAWIWWVLDRTDSATATAAIGIAAAIPSFILGPFAGAIVDRYDRRKVMRTMDFINAILYAGAGAMMFTGVLRVWHVYMFAALSAVATAFHRPALRSSIPNLVSRDQLTVANSFYQISRGVAGFIGLLLGGILVGWIGEAPTLLLDGATFALAGLSLLLVAFASPRQETVARFRDILADMMIGLRFVFRRRTLFYLIMLYGLVNFLLAPMGVLFSILSKDFFGTGPQGFGMLNSSVSVGLLAGGFVAAGLRKYHKHGWVICANLLLLGGTLTLFGMSRDLYLSMGLLAILGIAVANANVFQAVIFQTHVPNELQGRTFAAQFAISEGLQPIALALIGGVLAVASIPTVLVISGIGIMLATVGGLAFGGLTKL